MGWGVGEGREHFWPMGILLFVLFPPPLFFFFSRARATSPAQQTHIQTALRPSLSSAPQQQLRERDMQVVKLGGQVPADSGRMMPPAAPRAPAKPQPRSMAPASRKGPPRTGDTAIVIPGQKKAVVHLWIPTALMRGKGQDAYHVYQVIVRLNDDEWSIFRRYSHFHDLHKCVLGRWCWGLLSLFLS